jgi:hypothetical protein
MSLTRGEYRGSSNCCKESGRSKSSVQCANIQCASTAKRAIPSASKKALTASLRSLEAARVVLRRDLSSSVLHVEYELADTMREPLVALLDHLGEWGKLYDSVGLPTVLLTTTKSE